MESRSSSQQFRDRIIGLKPVGFDIKEVTLIDPMFLYSFSLGRGQTTKKDTVLNRDLENARSLIQRLISGEIDDWQSLFERAYGLGTKIDQSYDPESLDRVKRLCREIYTKELEGIELISSGGKRYLPEDAVSSLLQNGYQNPRDLAQAIYLAGYSAGVLCRKGEKKEVQLEESFDISDVRDAGEYIDLPQCKNLLLNEIQSRPQEFISRIFFQDLNNVNSQTQLFEYKQLLIENVSRFIPDFEKRIVKMIGEKRKRTVKLDGRVVSEWYKECSAYLGQALHLTDDSNQQGIIAGQLRRLSLIREVLERDVLSGRFQEQKNVDALVNEFLVYSADKTDLKNYSSQELYDRFIGYILNKPVEIKSDEKKAKGIIPQGLEEVDFSKEEQITILDTISPFDQAYTRELTDSARTDIFYRWIKALSILADIGGRDGGANLIRYFKNFREEIELDREALRKNISSLIEYGYHFEELTRIKSEKVEVVQRCEVLDEICHFIRVVTGLKFESKILSSSDLKLFNVSRQFVRMAYVLLNKKIARGEIDGDIYPVKPGVKYDENNLRFFGQAPDIGVYDQRVKSYPYLQSALVIPGLTNEESKKASILLTNLLLKYPFEIAIPTFLFTLYDCYGDINLSGVINQLFINRDQRRELKTCFVGKDSEMIVAGSTIRRLSISTGVYYQKTDLGLRPTTTIRIQLGTSTKNDNVMNVNQNVEAVVPIDWDVQDLRIKIRPIVTELLSKIGLVKPVVLDAEFFHIHADEVTPTNTQGISGVVARALNEEIGLVSQGLKVIGRPVIDNAHVVDRLNYDLAKEEALGYGVEVPEVVFEGSPLQQWIGDQLFRLIDPAKIVKRGDNLYFKVNEQVEVELYTNVGRDNVIQACVLNHIANDIYKLNPEKWNSIFKEYISNFAPDIYVLWQTSGYASFEEFYYQVINSQKTPEERQFVKDNLFKPVTSGFLNCEGTKSQAQAILANVLENEEKQVVPVQILEDFFDEQGEKYRALFQELKQQFTLLEKVQIYRITYGLNTGEVKLISLSN